MTGPNEYMADLLAKAEANGWFIEQYDIRNSGFVVLSDMQGRTKITIESQYGLDTPYYVEHIKARPLPEPIKP